MTRYDVALRNDDGEMVAIATTTPMDDDEEIAAEAHALLVEHFGGEAVVGVDDA